MKDIKEIDAVLLDNFLEEDQAILIDVREDSEFRGSRIAKAIHMPVGDIESLFQNYLHDLQEKNISIKDKTFVMQCRSGKRSSLACEVILQKYPELKIYNLTGGIISWINKGLPVLTKESF